MHLQRMGCRLFKRQSWRGGGVTVLCTGMPGGVTFLAPAGQGCYLFMHQQTYMQAFYAPAGQGVTFLCTRAAGSHFHAPAGDTFLCTSIVGMDQLGRYVTSPCARIAGVLFFYAPAGRRCHFLMHTQGRGHCLKHLQGMGAFLCCREEGGGVTS